MKNAGADLKFYNIIFLIFSLWSSGFSAGFMRLSEFIPAEAKNDTAIWVANPVPDKNMDPDETLEIDISYSFDWKPDSIVFYSITVSVFSLSDVSPVQSATFSEFTNRLRIVTKPEIYGHARVSYTANTSIGSATDIFLLRVEKSDRSWIPSSGQYNILPENCFGSGNSAWKAASAFDLGAAVYKLDCIEFGYGLDGSADWQVVLFDGTPTASVINGLSGTKSFGGGYSYFIENINTDITGNIAVVFSTNSNFMAMEPGGNSGNTWIYSESTGWEKPSQISPDYSGAWYIRLYMLDPSGIQVTAENDISHSLLGNYPNPFNNQTVIYWNMAKTGNAAVCIYNSKGELVRKYEKGLLSAGNYSFVFDSSGFNSGVYYYELIIDGNREASKKMLYLK